MPVDEFVEEAISHFDMLHRHHYIAKSQASFLKFAKESIPEQTVIIQVDFADNYSFIVQDAVHWNNSQATLHPTTEMTTRCFQAASVSFLIT